MLTIKVPSNISTPSWLESRVSVTCSSFYNSGYVFSSTPSNHQFYHCASHQGIRNTFLEDKKSIPSEFTPVKNLGLVAQTIFIEDLSSSTYYHTGSWRCFGRQYRRVHRQIGKGKIRHRAISTGKLARLYWYYFWHYYAPQIALPDLRNGEAAGKVTPSWLVFVLNKKIFKTALSECDRYVDNKYNPFNFVLLKIKMNVTRALPHV